MSERFIVALWLIYCRVGYLNRIIWPMLIRLSICGVGITLSAIVMLAIISVFVSIVMTLVRAA